jgi:hypothetical protein
LKLNDFNAENYLLILFNQLGQKVFETKISSLESFIKSNLERGIYIFNVLKDDQIQNFGKLIIEK